MCVNTLTRSPHTPLSLNFDEEHSVARLVSSQADKQHNLRGRSVARHDIITLRAPWHLPDILGLSGCVRCGLLYFAELPAPLFSLQWRRSFYLVTFTTARQPSWPRGGRGHAEVTHLPPASAQSLRSLCCCSCCSCSCCICCCCGGW